MNPEEKSTPKPRPYLGQPPSQDHFWTFLLTVFLLAAIISLLVFKSPGLHKSLPTPSYPPPSAEIAKLADQATMTDKAKQIFYAAKPEIDNDRAVFNQHCQAPISSRTVELGCFTPDNHIYLLRVSESQLTEIVVVTAAHEMLHAAYAQLSRSEISTIDSELEAEVSELLNRNLAQELKDYQITEPGQRDNELHSIIGTEYSPIMSSLEEYYSQYFQNRQTVVADARQFNNVFANLKAKLATLQSQIIQMRREMIALLRRRQIAAYNALVPQVNSLIREYNQTVAQYNALSRSLLSPETPEQNQ